MHSIQLGRPARWRNSTLRSRCRSTSTASTPNAAQALITWLMEAGQYDNFLQGSVGYLTQPLRSYDEHPVWTEDPKRAVFKESSARARSFAHSGTLGLAASSVFADFVVVNMVAEVAVGAKTPQEAAEDAQRRAERYYVI